MSDHDDYGAEAQGFRGALLSSPRHAGKVTPSATLMARIRRVAEALAR